MKLMTTTAAAIALTGLSQSAVAQPEQSGMGMQEPSSMNSAQVNTIDLDDLEDNPAQYVGQQVSVEGEVQNVLGPRLFSLDENNWIDFDGETLVYLQSPRVASLSDNDEVRVTGRVRMFTDVTSDVDREWGWIDTDPDWTLEMNERPVIVADSVVSTEDDSERFDWDYDDSTSWDNPADTNPNAMEPYDVTRSSMTAPITDVDTLADASGDRLVGRRVHLENARVQSSADKGYWIGTKDQRVFVLPSDRLQGRTMGTESNRGYAQTSARSTTGQNAQQNARSTTTQPLSLQPGDTVTIKGRVMSLPHDMRSTIGDRNADVYVYATQIDKQ